MSKLIGNKIVPLLPAETVPPENFQDISNDNSENGAQGRNRTTDTAIFSRMLYQLSYLGVPARAGRSGRGLIGIRRGLVQRPGAVCV